MERIKTGIQGRSEKKAIRAEKNGSRHFTCRTSLKMLNTCYTADIYNEYDIYICICMYVYIYMYIYTHTVYTYIICPLGNSVNHRTVQGVS
jgi:hypothetical protein